MMQCCTARVPSVGSILNRTDGRLVSRNEDERLLVVLKNCMHTSMYKSRLILLLSLSNKPTTLL